MSSMFTEWRVTAIDRTAKPRTELVKGSWIAAAATAAGWAGGDLTPGCIVVISDQRSPEPFTYTIGELAHECE